MHRTHRLAAILIGLGLAAEVRAKDEVKLEGRIGLGMQTVENQTPENLFELRMGFETRRKRGVEANIELRADEDSRDVSINDAFFDYKSESKTARWRGGRGKKILGWEYQYSTSARLTIERSMFAGYLGERSLVGRDYFVEFERFGFRAEEAPSEGKAPDEGLDSQAGDLEKLIDPAERWRAGISAHYDEVRNYAMIVNALYSPGPKWRFGGWLVAHRANTIREPVYAVGGMLSTLYRAGDHRAAVEIFLGRDPYRTAVEELYAGGRPVRFMAARVEYGIYLGNWNPYVAPSVVWRDMKIMSDRQEEALLGMKYFVWENLSVAVEGGFRHSRAGNPTVASYRDTQAAFMGRYFF